MTAATPPATPAQVLDFWFGAAGVVDERWFRKSEAYDREIAQRFGATLEAALAGRLVGWAVDDDGTLALILVLDQFARNLHRGSARAFAGDATALALALRLIDDGAYLRLPPLRRWFALMPLEHAEDLAVQRRCVQLFEALAAAPGPHHEAMAGALDYARRHHDVIARFGRFPHRNAALGRADTAAESDYLRQPGSGF